MHAYLPAVAQCHHSVPACTCLFEDSSLHVYCDPAPPCGSSEALACTPATPSTPVWNCRHACSSPHCLQMPPHGSIGMLAVVPAMWTPVCLLAMFQHSVRWHRLTCSYLCCVSTLPRGSMCVFCLRACHIPGPPRGVMPVCTPDVHALHHVAA